MPSSWVSSDIAVGLAEEFLRFWRAGGPRYPQTEKRRGSGIVGARFPEMLGKERRLRCAAQDFQGRWRLRSRVTSGRR